MLRNKLIPLILAVILVASTIASGCSCGVPLLMAIDLVPAGAYFVVSLNITSILSDPDIQAVYEDMVEGMVGVPQTLAEAAALLEEQMGIDANQFAELLIFGDDVSEGYLGFIWSGPVPEGFIDSVEQEFDDIEYNGYTIYTDEFQLSGICVLESDSMIISGSLQAVKNVLDARDDPGLRLRNDPGNKVYEAYNALGDVWLRVVAEVSEDWLGELPGEIDGISLELLDDIEAFGFSFDKEGEGYDAAITVETRLGFSSSSSASLFDLLMDALLDYTVAMLPDLFSPEIVDIIEGLFENDLDIEQSGSWVVIALEIAMFEMGLIIEELEGLDLFGENEQAYLQDKSAIQTAVDEYYYDTLYGGGCPSCSWPTADGHVPNDVDFSLLVDGGYLTEEPASSVGAGGSYTWQIDNQGNVISTPDFDGSYP